MKYKPTLPTIYEDKEFELPQNLSPKRVMRSLYVQSLIKIGENWNFFKKDMESRRKNVHCHDLF